ncbi:hydroxypyruvate isomerase [Polynucleobacter sp. MWH-Jannik1A5]|jgi:hydroxypyruvate isomerase|uniref:hydroxypyruvate isomerase n=1 Tax=Polynucleobacter sp. MWH-Jannik1A5 TaxID=1855890 RepID=UPI001C0C380A|nr:hydroxypyruvate isomerase [Polynucleobacter sp. MWH-Jannik1A5]MBU3547344.1 hydroxypyruvate isomerase [Polynucleobacter sp. MWH-Jannik1A5]
MPQFAANLTMLFNEHPFMDRFEIAAESGFKAVEFLFPYAYKASEIRQKLDQNNLRLVLHNLPAGDWDEGERGIACLPDRMDEFKASVAKAIEYAKVLGVSQLNCLAGKAPTGLSQELLRATLIANLRYAAVELKKVNIKLLIEPINTFDIPGFYLSKTQQALDILNEVGADNVYIQYDIYHAQRMEGELSKTLEENISRIAHIQLADNPGRHEPGTGEINYAYLFKLIDRIGYQGWIGCEYKPATQTQSGLDWIKSLNRL